MKYSIANKIKENYWFNQFNISNIGGIIGMEFESSYKDSHNIGWTFQNTLQMHPQQYALNIYPSWTDWGWYQNNFENYSNFSNLSSIQFGGHIKTNNNPSQTDYWLLLTTANFTQLNFTLDSFKWICPSYNDNEELVQNKSSQDTAISAVFNIGFNGIGMPKIAFQDFV